MKLGIFGYPFSQTDLASHLFEVRKEAEIVYFDTFEDLAQALVQGKCDQGVFPYHNSMTGDIREVQEILKQEDLHIREQQSKIIQHCLLGLEGSAVQEIETVLAHPQAWAQSEAKLKDHLLEVHFEAGESSAHCAQRIIDRDDVSIGCLGPLELADHLGLKVLLHDLEGLNNQTTFVRVGR